MISVQSRAGDGVSWGVQGDPSFIPYEIKDAVEMYARNWGRHGSVSWNPMMKCCVVELSLKADDPRMKAYREGRLKHEPKEIIPLHYQPLDSNGKPKGVHFVGLNIHELGVTGVLEILERGNVFSGRGEHDTVMGAVRTVADRNDRLKHSIKAAAMDNMAQRSKDMRRQILDLPLVSVPANIGSKNGTSTEG